MSRQPATDPDPRSTVQVVKDVTSNAQLLFQKELELAKLELQEALKVQLMAAGLAAAGGLFGLFVLGFVGVTAAKALEEVLQPWAAWLIVTGVYLLIGVLALLIAKNRAQSVSLTPERTKDSIEENVAWAKQQLRR